jgi:hypothetical protein
MLERIPVTLSLCGGALVLMTALVAGWEFGVSLVAASAALLGGMAAGRGVELAARRAPAESAPTNKEEKEAELEQPE